MPRPESSERSSLLMHSFKPDVPPRLSVLSEPPSKPGDGFTEAELASAVDPLKRSWDPKREYESLPISHLVPGPKAVTFDGKIVNLTTRYGSSAKQPKARGWHYLIVKDDTAAIMIKLYFANTQYQLRLGQPMTLWTAFISEAPKSEMKPVSPIKINANMFPGRVASDHILIHQNPSTSGICHTSLSYVLAQQLKGLITLDCYLRSGHDEITDARILLVVKSIGPVKRITSKGEEYKLIQVMLMDNTAEARVTLWNDVIDSAHAWQPAETVLLISNPGYRSPYKSTNNRKGDIEILRHTMIDINPDLEDTYWLRRWAEGKSRREAITWEFSNEEWDVQAAECETEMKLFTLAELDDWARSRSDQTLTGFINVTIMNMKLQDLHYRDMLMCGRCCGIPLYSNASVSPCATCSKPKPLMPNAHLIGALLDETGCINGSALLWSPRAWEQLFGKPVEIVASWNVADLALLEQRLSFLRLHLCVGWKGLGVIEGSVGRLYVLGVKM